MAAASKLLPKAGEPISEPNATLQQFLEIGEAELDCSAVQRRDGSEQLDSIYLNDCSDPAINRPGSPLAQRLTPHRNNTGIQNNGRGGVKQ